MFFFCMYSIYLYLYRSSASSLEIQMKKHKGLHSVNAVQITFYDKLEPSRQTRRPLYSSQVFTNTNSRLTLRLLTSSECVFTGFIMWLWAPGVLIIEPQPPKSYQVKVETLRPTFQITRWRLNDTTSKKRIWWGPASASSPASVLPASRKSNLLGPQILEIRSRLFSSLSEFTLLIIRSGEEISEKHTWSFFFFCV